MPVVMGRKTFQSLGKCLQGRENIVISSRQDFSVNGGTLVATIDAAIHAAKQLKTNEIFIIGGAQIYKATIANIATRIYMTRVHASFDNADAFFPEIDETQWQRVFHKDFFKDDKHEFDYTFETWERQ